jgi:hypothetical protein
MKTPRKPGACAGHRSFLACAACALLLSASAAGQCGETASELNFKLTPSWYQSSDGNDASDINVRANLGPHAAWLGYYRDHAGYRQARAGYEYTQDIGPGRLVWSGQSAAGGFLGGSVNLQLGEPWYLIAGFGRTNLHTYYNLNFDPNDAITLGIGATLRAGTELSLFQVRDDRLDTQQRVTHLYLRQELSDKDKLSVDGSYKTGLNDDGVFIRGYAVTVTYAHQHVFIRLARDRYANFSNATQNRVSLGATF